MAVKTLEVVILGNDSSAQRAFARTASGASTAATAVERAGAKMTGAGAGLTAFGSRAMHAGHQLGMVGKQMTWVATGPLALLGGAAVKMGLNFDRQMSLISTQAGGTAKEVGKLKDEVLGLARHSKFGPEELAKGLFFVESAGLRGHKAVRLLNAAVKLATVGNADLEETVFATAGAMNALGKEGQNFNKVAAVMSATVGHGHMRMEELVEALKTGLPGAAKSFGVSFEGMTSAVAFFTRMGEPANQAATRLRQTITHLATSVTSKGAEALKSIGMDIGEMGEKIRETGTIGPVIKELAEHLERVGKSKADQVLTEAFGGGRFGTQIREATDRVGLFLKTEREIGKTGTIKNLNREAKEAKEQGLVEMEEAWSSIKASLIEIGQDVAPIAVEAFGTLAHDVSDAAHWFGELPDGVKKFTVEAGLAVAAIGPLLMVGGALATTFGGAARAIAWTARQLGVLSAAEATAGVAGGAGSVAGGVAGGAGAAAGARWLGTEGSQAAWAAEAKAAAGQMTEREALAAQGGIFKGVAGGAGAGLAATAMAAAIPAAIAAAGIYKIATHTGHEMGNKIAAGVGDELKAKMPGALKKGLKTGDFSNYFAQIRRAWEVDKAAGNAKGAQELGRALHGISPELNANQARAMRSAFKDSLAGISADAVAGMKRLNADLSGALSTADALWVKGTQPWRRNTVAAMQATVQAIRAGMQAGTIPVNQGKARINRLLSEIHLIRGDDPLGLAKGMARSFQKAGGVTSQWLNSFEHKLEKMPKAAREKAEDATLAMLRAWAKGKPKIEKQVDGLTAYLEHRFGATNAQISFATTKLVATVAASFLSMDKGVSFGVNWLGESVNKALSALGVSKPVSFAITDIGKLGAMMLGVGGRAQGGAVRVPGSGLQDTVGLAVNGVMSARVAPGEDLVVFNRHQRPMVDYAMAATYGVNGLGGFFGRFDRPHDLARGGSVREPHMSGPNGALRSLGQAAIHEVFKGAQAFLRKNRPAVGEPGGPTGVQGGVAQIAAAIMRAFPGLVITSSYRPGDPGFHGQGRAIDLASGDYGYMNKAAAWTLAHFGRSLTEGIHDPNLSVKYGKAVPPSYWGEPTWREHLNHIHVAYAKGGEISKAGERARSLVQQVWPFAAPFFGLSGESRPPRTNFDSTAFGGAFVGDVKTFGKKGRLHKNFIVLPKWFEGWAGKHGEMGAKGPNIFKETLLHEWAHYFQNPGMFLRAPSWQIEGGAEAFARWAAPQIYARAGIPYHNPSFGKSEPYYPYVRRVLREKGWGWVQHGQFGRAKGGPIGFARGGSVASASSGAAQAVRRLALGAWYYMGRTRAQFPPLVFDRRGNSMWTADHKVVHIPQGVFPFLLSRRSSSSTDHYRAGLVHELTHARQRFDLRRPVETEGGAAWFQHLVAPGVYAGLGIPYRNHPYTNYAPYVEWVKKHRGSRWVLHGQFRRKGGLVRFAKGGLIGASTYGGPADPSSGTVGSSGVSLPGKMAFAELEMGHALGGLPYGAKLLLTHGSRSVVAEKLDIGRGGGPVNGHKRVIDLWYQTANALGLPSSWLGLVGATRAGKGAASGAAERPKMGLGRGQVAALPPMAPSPLLPSAQALSPSIQKMLSAPGLSYASKVGISELALGQAERTAGKEDDSAVLNFQSELFTRRRDDLKRRLAKVNRELRKSQSPKQRKRLLEQRDNILSELGTVEGQISGVESSQKSIAEEADDKQREATEALTKAIEEQKAEQEALRKAIEEQTHFAQSAVATSSATAWRALADILSGQLGPRTLHRAATAGAGSVGTL